MDRPNPSSDLITGNSRPRLWTIVALVLLMAVGLGLRLFDTEADSPAFFADGSQDFTTDGAYLTLYAKNHAEFGQWSLFGYEHWKVFKTSLITGTSALLYSLGGVTLAMNALTGILLSVLGLVVMLFFLSRLLSGREILYAGVFLTFNYLLILYGRFPFSENALLFLSAFAVGAFLLSSESIGGSLLIGVAIGLAAFFGKAFGVVLAAGPIAWWLSNKPQNRFALIGILIGSVTATLLACSLIFHGTIEIFSFLWAHGTGEHGFPHALETPLGFFENLMSYARTGLHRYTPFLSALAYLALGWSIFYRDPRPAARKISVFMASWLVTWIVALSVFNYRPLRYEYLLVVPMTILAVVWMTGASTMVHRHNKVIWWQIVLLIFLNWYFTYHLITPFSIKSLSLMEYWRWVWYVLPVAIALTLIELIIAAKRNFRVSPRVALIIGLACISLSVVNDCRLYYNWYANRTYGIRDANRDMAELLGPNAVVSGQIGPAITAGTKVRSFPMFVSGDLTESQGLLTKYPVTHLAVGANLWRNLKSENPQLAQVPIVARFWLRDVVVYLVPVYKLFGNPEAAKYQPSKFEEGVRLMFTGGTVPPDSVLKAFLLDHPDSRTANVFLYHWSAHIGDTATCKRLVEKLVREYPTDFSINLLAAIYYRIQSLQTKDVTLMATANEYLERSIRYNPINADVLRRMYTQSTLEMWTI